MKTTLEIADGLLREAKAVAHEQKITLRELVEDGLRLKLEQQKRPRPKFRLKDGSYRGRTGMKKDLTWRQVLALSYGDRWGGPPE